MSDVKLWNFHQNENRENLLQGYYRQKYIFKKIKKYIKK
jgi:hypothetical protein